MRRTTPRDSVLAFLFSSWATEATFRKGMDISVFQYVTGNFAHFPPPEMVQAAPGPVAAVRRPTLRVQIRHRLRRWWSLAASLHEDHMLFLSST